ncbi:MAG: DUF2188 domain-containing protein [Chthoniobacter sp.]
MDYRDLREIAEEEKGGAPDWDGMPMENQSLHVVPLTGKWIVEKDDGTSVGESPDRDSAIHMAREAAVDQEVSEIAVHSEDGQVEETLKVHPGTPAP